MLAPRLAERVSLMLVAATDISNVRASLISGNLKIFSLFTGNAGDYFFSIGRKWGGEYLRIAEWWDMLTSTQTHTYIFLVSFYS